MPRLVMGAACQVHFVWQGDGIVEDRKANLRTELDKVQVQISSLESAIACLKPGPNWKGVFRYRWHFDEQGDYNRFRQRIMFMLGYNKYINDFNVYY